MHRRFIAMITAASIALTAFGSTPVQASDRDTQRAIAAILGLAALGVIVHQNRKDDKKQKQHYLHEPLRKSKKHVHQPPIYSVPKPRPLPDRAHRKLLPKDCFRSFETHRGKVRMFGARCLNRHYSFSHRLPRECEYLFNTLRGERRGYEARCLRDRGYRLARG
ncbi:MAG: hypothetical protein AAF943_00580 [Pseudomonadota bacterium]